MQHFSQQPWTLYTHGVTQVQDMPHAYSGTYILDAAAPFRQVGTGRDAPKKCGLETGRKRGQSLHLLYEIA